MKVFALNGSYRENTSSSLQFLKRVEYLLKDKDIDFNIFSLSDYDIELCKGCLSCFMGKECKLNDDFRKIKYAMLDADIVIFVSPVFAHNVTGGVKNIIDRLASWTHYMPLAGKAGFIVSVSHDNGNQYVNEYLKKIFEYWGITLAKTMQLQNKVMSDKAIDSYAVNLAEVLDRMNRKFILDVKPEQEKLFKKFTENYSGLYKGSPDAIQWETLGYFKFKSFKNLIENR